MSRLMIMTVGKTHSGKTTFAKELEQVLSNSVVIDQDNHAEFLKTYYQSLLPAKGQNTLKYSLTQAVVSYAVKETNCHLIICNSNRSKASRMEWIKYYREHGFTTVLVNFNIPDYILKERIAISHRSKNILRTASNFKEVLIRQQEETNKDDIVEPTKGEADHLFEINLENDFHDVIHEVLNII